MRNSPFKLHSSPFAAAVCLKDWRAADTAMRASANLETAGNPQVTSEAKNKLVHDGRWNGYDTPPTGNANYAWILHMVSKLSDWSGATEIPPMRDPKGERGGAHQNLFYNTTAPGIVLFLNRAKPDKRQHRVLLVNTSQVLEKGDPSRAERTEWNEIACRRQPEGRTRGRAANRLPGRAARRVNARAFINNFIPDEGIDRIVDSLVNWKEEETACRASAPSESEGKPQVTSEARNKLSRIVDHAA